MEKKNLVKRILMSLFGVIICAISVGIFKIAALGVDPFQSFLAGLAALGPLKFGTLYVIANAVLFIFMLIFDRHYIGIEMEAQYAVWAEQRLAMAEEDKEIQGYVNGVFWERNSLSEQKAGQKE